MAQINVRIDDTLKEQGETLFNSLGLSLSSAISVFITQSIREGGLPFAVTTKKDAFYSEANMNVLRRSLQEAKDGKIIEKTIDELRAMEE